MATNAATSRNEGGSAQATRLESLLLLVREGSSAQIRENAAEKLGEVAVQSPASCRAIVQHVRDLVVDPEWDVRVAASKCIDVIARSLRSQHTELASAFAIASLGSATDASTAALTFETVDIHCVVRDGAPLLRSGGEAYQYETNLSPEQRKLQAAKQRRLLLRRISGSAAPIWATREDEFAQQMLPRLNASHAQDIADDIERSEVATAATDDGATAPTPTHPKKRAANELLEAERSRRTTSTATDAADAGTKKCKTQYIPSENGSANDADERVQLAIVADLAADLFESVFNAEWHVRHGALLALRQLFLSAQLTQSLATGASCTTHTQCWLEECLVRCICVLALDQFADYSFDGSVAPVRDVCAQVFGVLLGNLQSDARLLDGYLAILRALFHGATWHARHGALLGLKYLVVAHKRHAPAFVPRFFTDVLDAFAGLASGDDEVLVLAAEMLADCTSFLSNVPPAELQTAATLLWEALETHATAAETGTVTVGLVSAATVRALSAWYTHASVRAVLDADAALVARATASVHHIVPLLHDPMQAVRQAAVACAAAMFYGGDDDRNVINSSSSSTQTVELSFVQYVLPHLLLQLLRETDDAVRTNVLAAWKHVVLATAHAKQLDATVTATDLSTWTSLLWSTANVRALDVPSSRHSNAASENGSSDTVCEARRVVTDVETNAASRVAFADAIGYLGSHVSVDTPQWRTLAELLRSSLQSPSGERQCGTLLAIARWAFFEKASVNAHSADTTAASTASLHRVVVLQEVLGTALETLAQADWVIMSCRDRGEMYYSEQRGMLQRLRIMETRIVEIFVASGVEAHATLQTAELSVSAADASRRIAEHVASLPYAQLAAQPQAFEQAHFKRQDLFLLDDALQQSAARFAHRVQALGSCAYSTLLAVPAKKSGFLVRALMDAIKHEANSDFQRLAAQTLADFVVSQARVQRKCVAKIGANLCSSAVALAFVESVDRSVDSTAGTDGDVNRSSIEAQLPLDVLERTRVRVSGAENALQMICRVASERVFEVCPALNATVARAWTTTPRDDQVVQQSAHVVQLLVAYVDVQAFATCLDWLRELAVLVTQPLRLDATRVAVARAIASICRHARAHQDSAMVIVYEHVFVVLSKSNSSTVTGSRTDNHDNDSTLRGAMLVLHDVVRTLASALVPFVPSLVHYAMKTMSSQQPAIRSLAARAFAELVPLVPLQMDLTASSMSASLRAVVGENEVSRAFLQRLLAGKAVAHVDVAHVLAPGVSLRTYQQHGVDWLAFLFANSLHGILADDMGLGKTLQTLAAIAASLVRPTGDDVGAAGTDADAPCCLVVCPPIVTHHWVAEATGRLANAFGQVVEYAGTPSERKAQRATLQSARTASTRRPVLIVTTYAALRSDVAFLAQTTYAFVVLDEAHLVRNPTTALFAAVQQLVAVHRVALSGTPLQNNVADLWALFEFLMPGYLGDATTFRRESARPIARARERNATPAHKQTAALALTQLHQRVLPFVLRRTKRDVLTELPPKIISNVLVTMTPVQKKLYAKACGSQQSGVDDADAPPTTNVLASLQLLRKIVVHPSLAAQHAVMQQLSASEKKAAAQWDSSGKLVALRDLLVDTCDLGSRSSAKDSDHGDDTTAVAAPHRCLIFAQLRETLDVVERMFAHALPHVTFRRLDGRTAPRERATVVQQFNDDVSIDVLLLTTAVGGLGLTLTGADTVIFLEHAWNPFVDLQAMDRAHRIGQRRTVRVFRILVRATLEEHIMDLQAYKEHVASTIVAESDAQRSTSANTSDVLQLLQHASTSHAALVRAASKSSNNKQADATDEAAYLPAGAQALLGQLGELWDESQYDSLAFPNEE